MRNLLYFFLLLLLSTACIEPPKAKGKVYAEVNGTFLTFEEAKASIPKSEFRADSLSAYKNFKDNWIEDQLVLQEINRLNLLDSPDVMKKVERAKQEMLFISFQEAVLSSLESEVQVSNEEARNYYQLNKDKFLLDERYLRFRHLIAASVTDAENAKRDLMQGYEWDRVAKEYSLEPDLVIKNASKFWPESSALHEYETLNRYLRIIGVSEISRIEKINDNYHFVQLLEVRAVGEHPDLEWLLEQIKEWLIL